MTQPLNDYGGLLEEAGPGAFARFSAWMRQPRNLLVVGIVAVALVIAGGALSLFLQSSATGPMATETPTSTPTVTATTTPTQSPTPSRPATRTPVPSESLPEAPSDKDNSEDPITPNEGGSGSGSSGSGGSGSGGSGSGSGSGGSESEGTVTECPAGTIMDANGTCTTTPTNPDPGAESGDGDPNGQTPEESTDPGNSTDPEASEPGTEPSAPSGETENSNDIESGPDSLPAGEAA